MMKQKRLSEKMTQIPERKESTEDAYSLARDFLEIDYDQSAGSSHIAHTSNDFKGDKNVLSKQLRALKDSQELADMVINIKDNSYLMHKAVMAAQSPVFMKKCRESAGKSIVEINITLDVNPKSVKKLIDYLYGDYRGKLSGHTVMDLFKLAQEYDISDLKNDALQIIIKDLLSQNSFCDIMALAMKYKDPVLLKACKAFLKANYREISITRNWILFVGKNAEDALHLYDELALERSS